MSGKLMTANHDTKCKMTETIIYRNHFMTCLWVISFCKTTANQSFLILQMIVQYTWLRHVPTIVFHLRTLCVGRHNWPNVTDQQTTRKMMGEVVVRCQPAYNYTGNTKTRHFFEQQVNLLQSVSHCVCLIFSLRKLQTTIKHIKFYVI